MHRRRRPAPATPRSRCGSSPGSRRRSRSAWRSPRPRSSSGTRPRRSTDLRRTPASAAPMASAEALGLVLRDRSRAGASSAASAVTTSSASAISASVAMARSGVRQDPERREEQVAERHARHQARPASFTRDKPARVGDALPARPPGGERHHGHLALRAPPRRPRAPPPYRRSTTRRRRASRLPAVGRQAVSAVDDDRHVETLRRAPRDQLGAGRRSAHPDEDHELRARERHRRRRAERERGAALGRESRQHLARAMRIDPLEIRTDRRASSPGYRQRGLRVCAPRRRRRRGDHTSRSAVPW